MFENLFIYSYCILRPCDKGYETEVSYEVIKEAGEFAVIFDNDTQRIHHHPRDICFG